MGLNLPQFLLLHKTKENDIFCYSGQVKSYSPYNFIQYLMNTNCLHSVTAVQWKLTAIMILSGRCNKAMPLQDWKSSIPIPFPGHLEHSRHSSQPCFAVISLTIGISPSYNNSRCVYLYMFIFFLSPVLWLPL